MHQRNWSKLCHMVCNKIHWLTVAVVEMFYILLTSDQMVNLMPGLLGNIAAQLIQQELNYRQQIAHQPRTQYAASIGINITP